MHNSLTTFHIVSLTNKFLSNFFFFFFFLCRLCVCLDLFASEPKEDDIKQNQIYHFNYDDSFKNMINLCKTVISRSKLQGKDILTDRLKMIKQLFNFNAFITAFNMEIDQELGMLLSKQE